MEPLPTEMPVIEIEGGAGPASALHLGKRALPIPAEGQVLIKVEAAGVNRPDILQRTGHYPPPPGAPDTMGLEISGHIVEPSGRWKLGDPVVALLPGGGYAGYAAVDARHVLPKPARLTMAEAAALPEAVFTVYANVFMQGRLKAGETLLVHGGSSGIGTTAIQMARAAGARVFATVRGPAKAQAIAPLGADLVIDSTKEDFAERVKAAGGADVILDMVGAEFFKRNMDSLKMDGRIVFIAGLGGSELTVPIRSIFLKRAILTGSTLRYRAAEDKAHLAAEVERVVWPWIEAGKIRPLIDSTFPLADAAKAHERMESGSLVGKLALTL